VRLMQDIVGDTLAGRYRLLVRLAGGGMGEVYRAHDHLLERAVAVKVLQPSLASDPELVDRFKAEARAAARLTHPNVVAVYDWGSENEHTYFMVMEFVAGTDLRDVLVSRGCLEPGQAAEIVAALCDALGAAHARGLVHRDVKPENVLIARDGQVKVADFGIAVVVDADRTSPGGTVTGTLRYLAPEQARGLDATTSSDIWAAGALLAELVTGRPPQQGAGADFLHRRATEPIAPPSRHDGRVPRDIDAIVLRACALDPADRFGDAADMANALRRASVRSLPTAPPLYSLVDDLTGEIRLPESTPVTRVARRRRSRRRARVALLVAMLLALVAGGAYAALEVVRPARVAVPDLEGRPLAQARAHASALGLSLRVVDRHHHFGAPPGEVVSQTPASGRALEGAAISVEVSAGLPLLQVPELEGMPVDDASGLLRARGLELGRVANSYSGKPEGEVIGQTPAGGQARWGSPIDIVVSKGPEPVAVPALERARASVARARLRRSGFEVAVEKAYSNDVRRGRVLYTTPGAGTVIPGGSDVVLVVSLGPEFAEVTVPDVRNLSVDRARAALAAKNLRARVVQSCGGGSTVVESDPIQGTTVRENDRVALFVC
jgi:beta-lactam-binding protein with PASTA domain